MTDELTGPGCDKCGRAVEAGNDAVTLALYVTGDLSLLLSGPRHLLPVMEGGTVVCEGSPSRAQYLEGQPRDPRGSYPYKAENEQPHREAYAKMLADIRSDEPTEVPATPAES